MYDAYYGLSQAPFGLSPDVYFCYPHRSYVRAKAYMQYALHRGEGFVVVTGRPGMGKTTLIQDLLRDLGSRHQLVARIDSTQLDADDLLRLVTYSFGLKTQGLDKATLIQTLREFLLGRTAVEGKAILIVDEAQNLASGALEELRLITNLQHGAKPLAQIFLVGQETLRDLIRHPSLEQLHQRIVAACHLESLDLVETRAYIRHRLMLAGWTGNPVYTADSLRLIFESSAGVPRLINKVCDRLMLHGSLEERHTLTGEDTRLVLREFREEFLERIDDGAGDLPAIDRPSADLPEIDDLRFEAPPPRPAPSPAPDGPAAPAPGAQDPDRRTGTGNPMPPGAVAEGRTPAQADGAFPAPDAHRDPATPERRRESDPPNAPASGLSPIANPPLLVPAEPEASAITGGVLGPAPESQPPPRAPASTAAETRTAVRIRRLAARRRWGYGLAVATLLAVGGITYLVVSEKGLELTERAVQGLESIRGRAAALMDRIVGTGTESPPRARQGDPGKARPPAPRSPGAARSSDVIGGDPPLWAQAGVTGDPPVGSDPNVESAGSPAPSGHGSAAAEAPGQGQDPTGIDGPAPRPPAIEVTGQPVVTEPIGQGAQPDPMAPGSLLESAGTLPEPAAPEDRDPLPGSGPLGTVTPTVNEPDPTPLLPVLAVMDESRVGGTAPGAAPAEPDSGQTGAPVQEDGVVEATTSAPSVEPRPPPSSVLANAGLGPMVGELRRLGYAVRETDGGGLAIDLGREIRYAPGSVELPSGASGALQRLAALILRQPNARVTIIGRTDSSGSADYNRYLSLQRARNAERYLSRRGVPETRLSSQGLGEEPHLDGDGADPAGSSQRRIEILLKPITRGLSQTME